MMTVPSPASQTQQHISKLVKILELHPKGATFQTAGGISITVKSASKEQSPSGAAVELIERIPAPGETKPRFFETEFLLQVGSSGGQLDGAILKFGTSYRPYIDSFGAKKNLDSVMLNLGTATMVLKAVLPKMPT